MKRIFKLLLIGILTLCFSISASAAIAIEPFSATTHVVNLTFSGNTATCVVTINGASGTTRIDNVTITLRESDGTLVAQWSNLSAVGPVFTFSRNASPVTRGKTYTLSFTATIHRNGAAQPIGGSITRTYN